MNRISHKLVKINCPFRIAARTCLYPAGEYEVTTEEALISDMKAHRRLTTRIYISKSKGQIGRGEFIRLEPEELEGLISN
jgi:hypothetical protein